MSPTIARLRWLLVLACLLLMGAPLTAQDTGQICVQAFDDLNQDGVRDPDEAPISRGIAASLLNAAGVTIDTGLMQGSASPLMVCSVSISCWRANTMSL